MQGTKLSKRVVLKSLSPLLTVPIGIVGTELFSSATQKWGDEIIQAAGGKIVLLLLLFLISIIISLYILLRNINNSQNTPIHLPDFPNESEERKRREKLLANLANDEKELLRLYINGNKKSIRISMGYGNVNSLLENGIILRPTKIVA